MLRVLREGAAGPGVRLLCSSTALGPHQGTGIPCVKTLRALHINEVCAPAGAWPAAGAAHTFTDMALRRRVTGRLSPPKGHGRPAAGAALTFAAALYALYRCAYLYGCALY